MKNLVITTLIVLSSISVLAQKPLIGINYGIQLGKQQYFETGLNLAKKFKNAYLGEISIGIEDDINSTNLGYKLGLLCYNSKPSLVNDSSKRKIPLVAGISFLSYHISDNTINAIRPEIGLGKMLLHGSGRSLAKITYGFNLVDSKLDNRINSHLVSVSINTPLKSVLALFGIRG